MERKRWPNSSEITGRIAAKSVADLDGNTQIAPEIDGSVYLSETEAVPGELVEVTITDAREYEPMGEGEKK